MCTISANDCQEINNTSRWSCLQLAPLEPAPSTNIVQKQNFGCCTMISDVKFLGHASCHGTHALVIYRAFISILSKYLDLPFFIHPLVFAVFSPWTNCEIKILLFMILFSWKLLQSLISYNLNTSIQSFSHKNVHGKLHCNKKTKRPKAEKDRKWKSDRKWKNKMLW